MSLGHLYDHRYLTPLHSHFIADRSVQGSYRHYSTFFQDFPGLVKTKFQGFPGLKKLVFEDFPGFLKHGLHEVKKVHIPNQLSV